MVRATGWGRVRKCCGPWCGVVDCPRPPTAVQGGAGAVCLAARHGALPETTAAGGRRRRHPPTTAWEARQLAGRGREVLGPRSQPGIVRCWCFRPLPICRPHRRKRRWPCGPAGGSHRVTEAGHRLFGQVGQAIGQAAAPTMAAADGLGGYALDEAGGRWCGQGRCESGASAWERSFQGTQDPS